MNAKGILKFVVAFVLIMFVVTIPAQAQLFDVYEWNGERCVFARMYRDQYVANAQSLPLGLRKTLVACEKRRGASAQRRQPVRDDSQNPLGFFR